MSSPKKPRLTRDELKREQAEQNMASKISPESSHSLLDAFSGDQSNFSTPRSKDLFKVQEKALLLVEALPYIQQFAGETMVIKLGGHAMRNLSIQASFARDVTLLRSIGINVIVVHGGGPQIGKMLGQLNIESEFVEGMRVTDNATMDVVQMVLIGQVNPTIVQLINAAGGRSVGLSGVDGQLLQASRLMPNGQDVGRVGKVIRVDDSELRFFSQAGFIPVVSPIGIDVKRCETLNINADYAAGAIAEHTLARKLVLMTDIDGIKGPDGESVSTLTVSQAEAWIDEGVIVGGMIPKMNCALDAIRSGVEKVHILDGCLKHSILLELFTDLGVGTQLVLDDEA